MTTTTIRRRIDMDRLPPTVDLPTAAAILGIGRSTAYELVRTRQWPTPVLRLGRRIKVPTVRLLALLDPRDTPAGPVSA